MLLTIPIPNMISGVSQQAPSLRFPSQANEQINCHSSLIDGLTKRPPTRHIEVLAATTTTNVDKTLFHLINRDEVERYAVLVRGDIAAATGRLQVVGVDGTSYPVVYDADTKDYLACSDPSTDLRLMTIADYTFVVNRTKTVALNAAVTPTRNTEGLVTIVAGNYGSTYTVTVGSGTFDYVTSNDAPTDITTDNIAEQIRLEMVDEGLVAAGYTIERKGSTLWVRRTADTLPFSMTVSDSQSNRSTTLVKGDVPSLTDLPKVAPTGFVAKVVGDPESNEDEYYVKFRTTDGAGFGTGVWEETVAPNVQHQFNLTTMPHVLVREPDGSGGIQFRLKKGSWASRTVGDNVTALAPSVVGQKINDLFFFKNRLGFLSGIDKVTMSEAGQLWNFWRTTVVTVVDSDPIDIAVSHTRVSKLQAAIPYNDRLLLFSSTAQFSLGSTGEVLSPSTISVTQTTDFEADLMAKPVAAGRSIMFAQRRADFSGVREYTQLPTNDVSYDAVDITSNVNSYIRQRIKDIDVSTTANMAVVRSEFPLPTDTDPATLYIYKFFLNGNEKIQSAWSKWVFPGVERILGAGWIDADLYLVLIRDSRIVLEKITVQDSTTNSGLQYQIHLDRLVTPTSVTYSSVYGKTSIAIPYICDISTTAVVNGGQTVRFTLKQIDNATQTAELDVDGDLTAATNLYVGTPYSMSYEMGTPFLRSENRTISSGRFGLTYGTVVYSDTTHFSVRVSPKHRNQYRYEFNAGGIQSGLVLDSGVLLESGAFRFPIHAKNNEVTLAFESDSHLPCRLMSAEIEGNFVIRSRV